MATPPELGNSCRGSSILVLLCSDHNFFSVYGGSLECLLDDSLEVPSIFFADQLGEQVWSCVALPEYIVHLKAFEVVNESFGNVVVLEQHYFLGSDIYWQLAP